MDSMTYHYYPGTNRLNKISDTVGADSWGVHSYAPSIDIDSQVFVKNYIYDEIGNLISDSSEKITNIKWNVYGKIEEITKGVASGNDVSKIRYKYDASGNRIGKIVEGGPQGMSYTWYVRDAQGNTLGVYTAYGTNPNLAALDLNMVERHIYGSSRLGMETITQGVDGTLWDALKYYSAGQLMRGFRRYELTNHLGNVLTVISDKKKAVSSNGSLIDYFEPDIKAGYDYYPFGMPMRQSGNPNYRYGFNGQEKSNEIKGEGNSYTAEFWEYDPRLGRRWNLDPKPVTGISEYSSFANNPIFFSDPLGDTIKTRAAAEITNTTLSQKGGIVDKAQEAFEYKDARLVPAYNKKGKLVGYHVWDSKDSKAKNYIIQIEPGDIEEFKRRYDNGLMLGARILYAGGEPSSGVKKAAVGIELQDYKLMLEGIKEENKKAWSDPQFVVSILTSTMHAGLNSISSSNIPVTYTNTSKGSLKNYDVAQEYSASGVFESIKRQNSGRLTVVHNSQTATIVEISSKTATYRVSYYPSVSSTGKPTIKFSTPNTKGEWRTRESFRFAK